MAHLTVWMNGVAVAEWQQVPARSPQLTYTDGWLRSPAPRPLSLSLPLLPAGASHRGDVVQDYFDNLFPDNNAIRNRIRDRRPGARATGSP